MRGLILVALVLVPATAWAQFPSPTFNTVTTNTITATQGGSLTGPTITNGSGTMTSLGAGNLVGLGNATQTSSWSPVTLPSAPILQCNPIGQTVNASFGCLNMVAPSAATAGNITALNIGVDNFAPITAGGGTVGLYIGMISEANSSETWSMNLLNNVLPSHMSGANLLEGDIGNFACDEGTSGCSAVDGVVLQGGGTFPNFFGFVVNGPPSSSTASFPFGWHVGYVDGGSKDFGFLEQGTAANSFGSQGAHAVGLSLNQSTFSEEAILLNDSGLTDGIAWNGTNGIAATLGALGTGVEFTFASSTAALTDAGGLNVLAGDSEFGSLTTAGNSVLDLHSSGNNIDFDTRLVSTGGTTSAGHGNFAVDAASIALNATTTVSGGLDVITGDSEFGSLTAAGNSVLDLHSSGNNIDYDVRLISTGGTSTAGGGSFAIDAAAITFNAPVTIPSANTTGTAASFACFTSTGQLVSSATACP